MDITTLDLYDIVNNSDEFVSSNNNVLFLKVKGGYTR